MKQTSNKHSVWRKVRNVLLSVIFISVIVAAGLGIGLYLSNAAEIEEMNIKNLAYNYSSFLYYNDENGNSVEYQQVFSDSHRIWLSSEEIPQIMKDAIVSIEDERFYKHAGVDIKRTTGAVINWCLAKMKLPAGSYGGSTITQQVIKNITKDDRKTPDRKIKEMMMAVALERQLSKDEILTIYLNIVYFANNCYGVEAASNVYFNKHASELTLAETASIAGITQTPSKYDPFKNPDNNVEKRNRVLKKMLELNYITQDEYDEATESKLVTSTKFKEQRASITSYFTDQVLNDVVNDLQERKGYSQTFAQQQLQSGGLKIYITMDKKIQDALESVMSAKTNLPTNDAQAAMIIMDPYTGEIKGMYGGLGPKQESRGLNRATQMYRQPGSSFKPISAYAPALEQGTIYPSTVIDDSPVTIGNWSPKNSYSGFKGDMLMRKAIEISSNIAAIKTVDELKIENSFNFLEKKLHITTLKPEDKNLSSLSLGGLTKGVSPEQMAAAYSIFVNKGKYAAPYSYSKVVDSTGKVLLENSPQYTQAISEQHAYIMTRMLREVVYGSSGTGTAARLSKMPTYGKTGTTNDNYDKWFVGFTPYYVGAVWYGFDTPKNISAAGVKYNPSARIWKNVMEKIHSGLEVKDLTEPDGITAVNICAHTGKLAGGSCTAYKEYFVNGTQPKSKCSSKHGYSDITVEDNAENSENPSSSSVSPSASPEPESTSKPTEPDTEEKPKHTEKPDAEETKKPEKTKAPEKTAEPKQPEKDDDKVINLD